VILVMMFVLILLQIKHWYIDFVNQTEEEIQHKGIYLDWIGIKHSVKHGVSTFVILWAVLGWVETDLAFALATVDFLLHYHIDWLKMNYGNRDIRTPQFWNHLGLDQMAHQIVYIIIAGLTVL
jgi:hypothetical protein